MIVGIVTLFTILFFGGAQEYFFIEKLEKGVKKFVVEKDRSKEILADLKLTKSMIKDFNKARKGKLSEFHSLNLNRTVSREVLEEFFDERVAERKIFQKKMIERRLLFTSKIEDDEWEEIINLSDASVEKKMSKLAKKKSPDLFESVMKSVKSNIEDQDNQSKAISIVVNFKNEYTKLLEEVNAVNSVESELLSDKNSTAQEFQSLADDMNQLREKAYMSLIDLHFKLKDITNDGEWGKVMKSIYKIVR
ncbi:MAG: hypothetical protein MI975_12825 [Cytophagales bacterium]|nr:hypothetical protein [Cytophagales bacterium]